MSAELLLRTSEAALRERLAAAYGLGGALHALAGEVDANLRLERDDGSRFLVKVAAACTGPATSLQIAALRHVEHGTCGVAVPQVVTTVDGRDQTTLELPAGPRTVWVTSWLDGDVVASRARIDPALCHDIGRSIADIDRALADFDDPRADRGAFKWDLAHADWIGDALEAIDDDRLRTVVRAVHDRFVTWLKPRLTGLRRQVVHNDANDHNLMYGIDARGDTRITGVFDFGDLCETVLVADVAIAATYAAMRADDALAAIDACARGYDSVLPLTDDELLTLVPLIETRLAVSITNACVQRRERPDDPYVVVSLADARRVLLQLHGRHPRVAEARLRTALERPPHDLPARVRRHLTEQHAEPVLCRVADAPALDLSFESLLGGDDPLDFDAKQARRRIVQHLDERGQDTAIGRYAEPRPLYTDVAFRSEVPNGPRRTVHLGLDLFAPAGTEVRAPFDGTVVAAQIAAGHLDYGGLVVLAHELSDGGAFCTLHGHLAHASIARLSLGERIAAGVAFANLGDVTENGGWPPHLHLQVLAYGPDELDGIPQGVADPDDRTAQLELHPDPSTLAGIPASRASYATTDGTDARRRSDRFASNLKTSYRQPLSLVRGSRHFLFDRDGRQHLDAYNNVPHVGHCHPHVVEAVHRQTALLATNTRYLHDGLERYAERLTALLPAPLEVCFFTASGSEANELALRLARQHTGRQDVCVMDHGYHGHTTATMAMSPYKFRQPGAPPKPDWVHVTAQPDVYRGPHRGADAGVRFADDVARELERHAPAAYLSECLPSVGGQLVLPDGFLPRVYAAARRSGVVCVADDVQTALWRTGSHAFGFGLYDAVPDVLVLGKPLGNGFPLGAVVTTRAIADSFASGPEFFSTFGGSTVAMAAGLAVLDVLDNEDLASRARDVGAELLQGLRELQREHECIGDVRGRGFFLGVELVEDRDTKRPATERAARIKECLRRRRVLIGTDGPHDNVLKIRPPMTFDRAAAACLLAELAAAFDAAGP